MQFIGIPHIQTKKHCCQCCGCHCVQNQVSQQNTTNDEETNRTRPHISQTKKSVKSLNINNQCACNLNNTIQYTYINIYIYMHII